MDAILSINIPYSESMHEVWFWSYRWSILCLGGGGFKYFLEFSPLKLGKMNPI